MGGYNIGDTAAEMQTLAQVIFTIGNNLFAFAVPCLAAFIAYAIADKDVYKRQTIGYCRVSSHKQKDDLERQIDNVKTYLLAKGQPFEVISDIGSGIDYKKKGLQELIRRISQNQVEKVVVLYKDRLLRFGFELIEYIASLYNCEIEIIRCV